MKTRLFVTMLLGAFLFSLQESAEARGPFKGEFRGKETRKCKKAKPPVRSVEAKAVIVQNGPDIYDSKATITATGGGEKLVIVLDLNADNTGTVTVNGSLLAGPGARSHIHPAARKLTVKLAAKGTATFVGPLKQTITMTGKSGSIPFKVTGVIDLNATGGLILDLKVTFSKESALGKTASFSFRGARQ